MTETAGWQPIGTLISGAAIVCDVICGMPYTIALVWKREDDGMLVYNCDDFDDPIDFGATHWISADINRNPLKIPVVEQP